MKITKKKKEESTFLNNEITKGNKPKTQSSIIRNSIKKLPYHINTKYPMAVLIEGSEGTERKSEGYCT